MTNSELMMFPPAVSGRLLTSIEQQKQFILLQAAKNNPCPNCATPVNQFAASGLSVNDFPVETSKEPEYRCPQCQRQLLFTLPWPSGSWHWRLVPEGGK